MALSDSAIVAAPGRLPLLDALRLRFVVVGALMMREIHTRYGRENIGFFWLFGEPLMFCLGVTLLWSLVRSRFEHGIPIISFVLTGYGPLMLWRHSVARAVHCFRANAMLLYHKQVGIFDLLAARVVLETLGGIAAFAVLAAFFGLLGEYELPEDLGLFYLGWFYMFLFSAGCAIVFACLSEIFEWFEKVLGPISYLMVPLSGFVFMVDWLPEHARKYALVMPSVHAYEMIRGGQYGADVHVHYDILYVTLVCTALIGLGLVLTRIARKYVQVE